MTDGGFGHLSFTAHPTADIEPGADVGVGTRLWHYAHVRSGAKVGAECVIGRGVYIDAGAVVGDRVKIQNYVSVFRGVVLSDGVFVGPHVCFTNDRFPRAVLATGELKAADDWELVPTDVARGASIGANSTIVCGIRIGQWAMVAAGSVVTRDVPDHALAAGNPARVIGWVTAAGERVDSVEQAIQGGSAPEP